MYVSGWVVSDIRVSQIMPRRVPVGIKDRVGKVIFQECLGVASAWARRLDIWVVVELSIIR